MPSLTPTLSDHSSAMTPSPESPSSDGTAAESNRKQRALRACDSCHKKKIRCDGVRPRCNWCMHHRILCTFVRECGGRRRQNRSRKPKELHLVQRMERIEQLLAENLERCNWVTDLLSHRPRADYLTLTSIPGNPDGADPPTPATIRRIYSAGYKLGDINLFHGVPFLSRDNQELIGFQTEETHSIFDQETDSPLWQNQQQTWPSLSRLENLAHRTMTELPARDVLEPYLDICQSSPFATVFPMADPHLIPPILEKAYNTDFASSQEVLTAKSWVFCFLAFASMSSGFVAFKTRPLPPIDIAECVAAAQLLILDILNAQASTEVVDALMMLAVYHFSCGNIQTLDLVLSLAARFLFMLRAHLYPGEDIDSLPMESQDIKTRTILHRRDMFWICYFFDKEITFRTGRPPIMNDTSCDLTFPKYYLTESGATFQGVSRLPGDLRLSLIKSKAYEKLYSPHALRKSDADILKDIRELDDLLENWRQSIPPESRPTLTFSQEAKRIPNDSAMNIPRFLLRLEYHHCMTTIHQASSRCKNWAENHRKDAGLASSLGLALEASRSLLSYLHFAEHILVPNIFWIYIFYPISAKLALFANILLNPSSPAAASDLHLLSNTLGYLNSMHKHTHGFSDAQLQHAKRVNEFVVELVNVAKSVVRQAAERQ